MKLTLIVALSLLFSSLMFADEKASDTVTTTTTPLGATVSWNRKVIGVTPLTYKVGEYAFNARKTSLFSKRLDQPVNLHITLPNYIDYDVTITGNRLIWRSLNGKNAFRFYVIPLQNFAFRLDKVSAALKTLTNADVIELWTAGFGDELVVEKINGSATAFTLEINDLLELRKAGVSDFVIQAMLKKSTKP